MGELRAKLFGVILTLALLCACSGGAPAARPAEPDATPSESVTLVEDGGTPKADDPALDVALSTPVEDSVYPNRGDPGVDALHYDLDLAWSPETELLDARATILLRSTRDDDHLQLDLAKTLEVESVTLDDAEVEFEHDTKDLVVGTPVEKDRRYVLVVRYSGTPKPTAAPTTRSDFSTNGWTITEDGEVWTMQEPHGAFTWYPVNDQPADKALYDFTITVPSPWTGIANGELVKQTDDDGQRTTRWHLSSPASSYLVTIAIGDYTRTTNTSASGLEISYWVPSDQPELATGLEAAAAGLDWLEEKLGPYPFDTLGFLLVPSFSGMESQTTITLGATDYTTSAAVLVHEMAHHWYGDQVTPNDWRDVWMNEGMAQYLQGLWLAEDAGITADEQMDEWAQFEPDLREESGPPADYDPAEFAEGNVYYCPALMWHELRQRLGDEEFFAMVRAWPEQHPQSNAGRDEYLAWIEDFTGEELTAFFDAWLLGETSPPRD